jgi:3-oxoacyl-[acyl-carrier protein] reductase
MARSAAKELLPLGVSLNFVSPGLTRTDLLKNYDPRALEIMVENSPSGRLADPVEIAEIVASIININTNYMHGNNTVINNGDSF